MRSLYKLNHLSGFKLHATDGEIGRLIDILFDDRTWTVRYFVVRTGSWFLDDEVLILPSLVNEIDTDKKQLIVDLSREKIKNCPPVDKEKSVSLHYEQEYYHYYDWEPYWSNSPFFYSQPYIDANNINYDQPPEHPHLRSSNEVSNYIIHAKDGDIGEVKDFILHKTEWTLAYMEIDTQRWLPGKHILIAPNWVEKIDWKMQQVSVGLTRNAIKNAPEYDPQKSITLEDENNLYLHYSGQ